MKLSCMALDVVQNAVGEESLDPGGTKGMEVGGRERDKVRGNGTPGRALCIPLLPSSLTFTGM